MTVAMSLKMSCLPNRTTMMMKLIQSRLENILRSKVMKKTYQYKFKKCKVDQKKISTRLVTKVLT